MELDASRCNSQTVSEKSSNFAVALGYEAHKTLK